MIECVFTVDYEIYGNGHGTLEALVYEPAQRMMRIFEKAGVKLVVFVEAAELEKIDSLGTDPAIGRVKEQIREFHQRGFEIGLHLHPQWCNARYQDGRWALDYSEYNLCPLPAERLAAIVKGGIAYLRRVLSRPDFTPLSFRAGNWLLQPTRAVAEVLTASGIKIDSSVFKGGLQHQHGLDYRPALRNGPWWKFHENVAREDPAGILLEIPIFTQMMPFWKMATGKRIGLQSKGSSGARPLKQRLYRLLDLMRFWHPLKFDFCRMTLDELVSFTESAIEADRKSQSGLKPMVAIGHTKDLVDFETVEAFLKYLEDRHIQVSTLKGVWERLSNGGAAAPEKPTFHAQ